MPDRSVEFLLIGGGLASASCARHLREQGVEGEVLIVGRELDPPYNRPPLSKRYLAGTESREEVMFRPEAWYADNGVELMTRTSVMSLDPGARVARLADKREIGFGKALIATGSNVRILHVDGGELEGIHYLRTLRNADSIAEELAGAERVGIVGGSYIGTELAATLTASGKSCEIVMQEQVVHERFCGPEVGRFFQDRLIERGVRVHGGEELDRLEGDGRVRRLVTRSGLEVDCDLVLIGAGVHPEVRLAEQAGLEVSDGVVVDRYLETSAPGIYAAGDCARYDSVVHRGSIRVEHWDVALNHGRCAAMNMAGSAEEYGLVPYFWSDLADWASMESVGPAYEWDEVWWRGAAADGAFTAWLVRDSRLAGAVTVGRSEDLAVAARLIASATDLSAHRGEIEDLDSDISGLG